MSMSVISGTGSFDGLHGMNMLADQDDRVSNKYHNKHRF